ncbi:protein-glutamate O-methyltransferase CheR [Geothrix sp. PMB-07]|uniref:CheR family methyltransferase n=1 Tax=Geothrix sp. PMB-07 TaxID=3068640 RepID=UPI0027419DE5|nr:protein-glutamate O-methyltransferase CheR [Geothrix sp. PMB-07]WLT30329.1 protein-glutamate O-methyltransferase CheR [Geothrix sp. PMB-07]
MSGPRGTGPDPLASDREALTVDTFKALRERLYNHSGIALAPHKITMVQSRLAKRLRSLGLRTYEEYLRRLETPDDSEWSEFINALTTNLTSFFREGHHFTQLVELLKASPAPPRRLRIWSAGCSTGEEPYTLAMTLLKAFGQSAAIHILATDLDTAVLETAARGVYPEARIEGVEEAWKRFAFLRGTGDRKGMVRLRPEVRQLITFQQLNLLDERWDIDREPFQAIFCRNVMIYFDKPTQRRLLKRFHDALAPDGLLFVGHSEALLDTTLGFQSLGQTMYRRRTAP